jgi:isoaspartyl peptidase/L-asparaginase-like protein (Ntn-hydrolase superfamily)
VIISTWSFGKRGNDAAWRGLSRGGSALDAVEQACCAIEIDPDVDSVGFGGLPDASGHVTLDGCVMLSPARCGSVCAVRRFLHPVSIARRVMERTPHMMLAGDGADAFATQEGFTPADLLSADAQDAYRKWMRDHAPVDQSQDRSFKFPRPVDRAPLHGGDPTARGSGKLFGGEPPKTEDDWKHHDTIGVLAIDSHGEMAGACSTSGTPYKLPGRVGDSPIIGHGLYVDPAHGAAVATGTGELIMGVCGSFLAVECMRRGAKPVEALREVLQRIVDHCTLREDHQVAFIALRPDGAFASAALRSGYKTSVHTSEGSRVIDPELVMVGS